MSVRRLAWAVWPLALVAPSCEKPIHPNDPNIPDEICRPRCVREHQCDGTIDVESCVSHCEHAISPRNIYDRPDYVAAVAACAQSQPCVPAMERALNACQTDAFRRLAPSDAARSLCKRKIERDLKCGDYRWDVEHCLQGHKAYSDAILNQLADCLDRPCNKYGRCMVAVVGEDVVWEDEDRVAQYIHTAVREAGPASVQIQSILVAEAGTPVPDATICLLTLKPQCVRSGSTGAFVIAAPAHAENAITIKAAGFGDVMLAVTTVGTDVRYRTVALRSSEMLAARYKSAGVVYPDDALGFVFATAESPAGSEVGLEGLVMDVTPAARRGPVYFSSSSEVDPARTFTSTFSSALFAGVQPGEATLTFGPLSVTCIPLFGGWPSSLPNAVRVPIAAGFETRVAMRCHK